jgi:hypothetical protein
VYSVYISEQVQRTYSRHSDDQQHHDHEDKVVYHEHETGSD